MTGSRWSRSAAGAGLLFVVLLVVAFLAGSKAPSTGDSATKIRNYYLHHQGLINLSALLTYLAVFVGIWFYLYLWRYFTSFDGYALQAAASLVGAALFGISGALSAGVAFAFTDQTKKLNDGAFVAINQMHDLTYPLLTVGLAIFYAAVGVLAVKAGAFPTWLGWLSWVFAVVALVPFFGFFAFLATPIWILIVVALLMRMPVSEAATA